MTTYDASHDAASYDDLWDEIDARRPAATTTERHLPAFCYGTLRSGEGNWSWCLQGRTVAEIPATLTGAQMWTNGGFPYVSMTGVPEGDTVVGELMFIPEHLFAEVLRDLDGLEGYHGEGATSNMYDRKVVTVTTADGEQVEAYAYIVAPGHFERSVLGNRLPRILSGDWLARHAEQDTRDAYDMA